MVNYVNTNLGTVGHLLTATSPSVYYPHGMMHAVPNFNPGLGDRYFADKIYSFSLGPVNVTATRKTGDTSEDFASEFDHDIETASPHKYEVWLSTPDINTRLSVHKHSAIIEFDFGIGCGDIILYANKDYTAVNENFQVSSKSRYFELDTYYHAFFSQMPEKFEVVEHKNSKNETIHKFSFSGGKVCFKIGISFIDGEQAYKNLQIEIPEFNIDETINKGADVWNRELGKIGVKGDETKKRVFYTALYRALARPFNLSEYGRYFGYDKKVHNDDGHEFYTGDGLWDTFRCMHTLQMILDEKVHEDILESYIRMYEQSGLMPNFPYPSGDKPVMFGQHSASIFADAYVKGVNFRLDKAYEGVRKNKFERTMLPWCLQPSTELDKVYYEKGFFPSLEPDREEYIKEVHGFEKRQAVAVTIENSYSDWCAYILAKASGRDEEADILEKRSKNFKNLFNPDTSFMAPKTADGKFIENFNPKLSGGQGGRLYFAENNSWIYSLHVFHDIDGLIALYGGKDEFEKRLDRLYVEGLETSKFDFLKQFPDATGLMGQFCMGNEPSFHIPYLYNYIGKERKTQKKIHDLIDLWFTNHPLGICGDEDGGAMSSWLVFSAMGFYPVCPGTTEYAIGSPIFDEIVIETDKAKLTIKAEGASSKKKYIKSKKINGQPFDLPFIKHNDLYNSNVIEFTMSKQY